MTFLRIGLMAAVLSWSAAAVAHSGGTNSCGCHVDSSTDECHCHEELSCGCDCEPSSCDSGCASVDPDIWALAGVLPFLIRHRRKSQ